MLEMVIRNQQDYDRLAALAFTPDYAGYKPNVVESPDGDARFDVGKRYAHLATKYFTANTPQPLQHAFWDAFDLAWTYTERRFDGAIKLDSDACALRLLEYPPGVGGAAHTDFDLLTLNLWRSEPAKLASEAGPGAWMHIGELWPLLWSGSSATRHWVEPSDRTQYSAVFFALPAHSTKLPNGDTVGSWLQERLARSRKEVV